MAIPFLDNIAIKKKAPNVDRDLFETIADMVSYSENYLPAIFQCYVVETGKRYVYNVSNSIDPVFGKWREDYGGSGDFTNYYNKSETNELLDSKADKDPFDQWVEVVTRLDGTSEVKGSVKYLDAQTFLESKGYTDEQIEKINKKKSISCDEKPEYDSINKTITYIKNGESFTISEDEIWFYYMAESDLNNDNIVSMNEIGLAQTIWIDGEEFTIMSFGLDMSEYVNKNIDVVSEYTGTEVETNKIPDIKALQDLDKKLTDSISDGSIAEKVSYENESYPLWTNVKKAIDGILAKVDYVKPSISSFTMTPSTDTYEVGQEVTEIDFAWTYNKNVTSQSLTDVALEGVEDRNGKWTGNLKTSKTFTLTCSDGQNSASATKSIDLSSYDYIFFIGQYKTSGSSSWKDIQVGAFNIKSYEGRYFVNVCFYKGSMYVKSGIYFGLTDKVTKSGSMSSIKIFEGSGISAVKIDQIYLSN